MPDSFETLLDYIKKQDKRAERLLVDHYYTLVFHIAYSMTKESHAAEDIVQETFIKIFAKLHTLQDVEKLEGWIKTIARRTTYDALRKQKKWNETALEDVYLNEGSEIDTQYEENEIAEMVEKTMEKLDSLSREILRLKLIEGYTDEEIARELSIKLGTVKSRIHRAKAKVKEALMKGGGEHETFE